MVRNMILLVHDRCMWPRTHPGCPVTHQNVSRVLGKALKIFATIVTRKTKVHFFVQKTTQNRIVSICIIWWRTQINPSA